MKQYQMTECLAKFMFSLNEQEFREFVNDIEGFYKVSQKFKDEDVFKMFEMKKPPLFTLDGKNEAVIRIS
ncbi:hypothetical protein KAR91_84580 [Candidatus Pacearchaeota archaeon]|nr:hypothetical protein [Candidatus Pacearchaeota archaeon]